jgi:hypothetical protein
MLTPTANCSGAKAQLIGAFLLLTTALVSASAERQDIVPHIEHLREIQAS